jgi:SAM-dependent methyltransferase
VPPGARWLDVGCGTGALTQTILNDYQPAAVRGVEKSEGFLATARARVNDPRASFEQGDARALPVPEAAYDAIVSGLVLNFVPEPERALAAMARAARPTAVIAAYVWDYAQKMELMRYFWDAAIALDPAAADLDEGPRFPLCHPDALQHLWQATGLTRVETRGIEIDTRFVNFDDYWSPFLGGQGPGPAYAMSLSDDRRAALREHLRTALPTAPDGSIRLMARAWAVKGQRA